MQFDRKRVAATLGAAVILATIATTATASIPDSDDGEFHVCIQTNRSVNTLYSMMVIDPSLQTNFNGHCNTGYTEYTLNQQGPAGPQGPKGDPGDAAPQPHVKIVKKSQLSGSSGGDFTIAGSCGSGWVATALTWKVTPSPPKGTGDVIVWPVRSAVNPDGTDPAAFLLTANSRNASGGTNGQVEIELRATCFSNVVSDGVTTS